MAEAEAAADAALDGPMQVEVLNLLGVHEVGSNVAAAVGSVPPGSAPPLTPPGFAPPLTPPGSPPPLGTNVVAAATQPTATGTSATPPPLALIATSMFAGVSNTAASASQTSGSTPGGNSSHGNANGVTSGFNHGNALDGYGWNDM